MLTSKSTITSQKWKKSVNKAPTLLSFFFSFQCKAWKIEILLHFPISWWSHTPLPVTSCFWSNLKESRGALCQVFEVVKRISVTTFVLFLKQSERILEIAYLVFAVIWKDIGDPLWRISKISCLVFEVAWKNLQSPFAPWFWSGLKESRGRLVSNFSSSLKDFGDSFCFVVEGIWKNLVDFFCFVFEVV